MLAYITATQAPALGDVRSMAAGDVVLLRPDAPSRKDWGRYQDAIGCAVARGAVVHQLAQTEGEG
jgi:hypothetical protein